MKLRKILAAISLFILMMIPLGMASVSATDIFSVPCSGTNAQSATCPQGNRTANPIFGPGGVIIKAASIVTFITGVSCIVIIIIGGIKYITSAGDPNSVNSAKNTILYALVGLVVSLAAREIIIFVINAIK